MPKLITNIQGEFFESPIGETVLFKKITGEVQEEDYINLNGYIAYLQNLSKVQDTFLLLKPANFGLKNNFNLSIINIEIDY